MPTKAQLEHKTPDLESWEQLSPPAHHQHDPLPMDSRVMDSPRVALFKDALSSKHDQYQALEAKLVYEQKCNQRWIDAARRTEASFLSCQRECLALREALECATTNENWYRHNYDALAQRYPIQAAQERQLDSWMRLVSSGWHAVGDVVRRLRWQRQGY